MLERVGRFFGYSRIPNEAPVDRTTKQCLEALKNFGGWKNIFAKLNPWSSRKVEVTNLRNKAMDVVNDYRGAKDLLDAEKCKAEDWTHDQLEAAKRYCESLHALRSLNIVDQLAASYIRGKDSAGFKTLEKQLKLPDQDIGTTKISLESAIETHIKSKCEHLIKHAATASLEDLKLYAREAVSYYPDLATSIQGTIAIRELIMTDPAPSLDVLLKTKTCANTALNHELLNRILSTFEYSINNKPDFIDRVKEKLELCNPSEQHRAQLNLSIENGIRKIANSNMSNADKIAEINKWNPNAPQIKPIMLNELLEQAGKPDANIRELISQAANLDPEAEQTIQIGKLLGLSIPERDLINDIRKGHVAEPICNQSSLLASFVEKGTIHVTEDNVRGLLANLLFSICQTQLKGTEFQHIDPRALYADPLSYLNEFSSSNSLPPLTVPIDRNLLTAFTKLAERLAQSQKSGSAARRKSLEAAYAEDSEEIPSTPRMSKKDLPPASEILDALTKFQLLLASVPKNMG